MMNVKVNIGDGNINKMKSFTTKHKEIGGTNLKKWKKIVGSINLGHIFSSGFSEADLDYY